MPRGGVESAKMSGIGTKNTDNSPVLTGVESAEMSGIGTRR